MKRNGLTLLYLKPSDSSLNDAGGICTRGGEEGQHSRWGEFVPPPCLELVHPLFEAHCEQIFNGDI